VLTGRVTRTDDGGPFVGALVTVAGTGDTAVTGDNGQFTLRGLPTGSRTLEVRALGWEPEVLPVELTQRTARHIVVPLVTRLRWLEAVVVTATLNVGLHRIGFDSRKQRGVGHFITADDIAKRTAMEFVDLMTKCPVSSGEWSVWRGFSQRNPWDGRLRELCHRWDAVRGIVALATSISSCHSARSVRWKCTSLRTAGGIRVHNAPPPAPFQARTELGGEHRAPRTDG